MSRIIFLTVLGLLLSFTACSHWYEDEAQALAKKVSEETTESKPDETNEETTESKPDLDPIGKEEPPETPKLEPSCEEVEGSEKAEGGTSEKREGLHGEAQEIPDKAKKEASEESTEGVWEREKSGGPRKPSVEVIFEQERVHKKTFVSCINEGDEIVVQLAGVKKTKKFSDVYQKTVTSVWVKTQCDYTGCANCSSPDKNRIPDGCFDTPHYGKCTISTRDYVGDVESPIEFPQKPEYIPLQFIISDKPYRADKINFS